MPLASVNSVYGCPRSGYLRMGCCMRSSFRCLKASSHFSYHTNSVSCLVRFMRDLAISENLGTNFLLYPIKPRNCFTSFGVFGLGILRILSSFSGSGVNQSSAIKYPRYWMCFLKKSHFSLFILNKSIQAC